jgi:rod shape determining protein RodA
MRSSINYWRQFDYVLLGTVFLLIVFGVLMIASATRGAIDPDIINDVPDQILYATIGFILVFLLASIDYRLLGGLHTWIYILMVVLLLLVRILGQEGDAGSQRWINLGIRIQPSELGKIMLIVTLGYHLSQNYHQLDKLSTVIKSLIHLAIPAGLVFIQPNLGTTIVFVVIWLAMIWAAGLRFKHIGLFLIIFLVVAPIMYTRLEDYQKRRVTQFINPEGDRQAQYNIEQAKISIGSGGLFGKGYLRGTQCQLRFLRVRHTDFIFSCVSEEFGMFGGLVVMALIGMVIVRILQGARVAPDPFGSMICYGVAAIIFFHTFVSIGMNLNLMPVTGLPLPFISAGGTSLLSMLMGIGLSESVIIRRRRV